MLWFIPKEKMNYTGSLGSYQENFNAIANLEVAQRLNDRHKERYCKIHPASQAVITVDVRPEFKLEIAEVCCDNFRRELIESFATESLD